MKKSLRTLEVILKTAERCNLDCPYCYFFYAGNDDYKKHPPLIAPSIANSVASYLQQAIQDYGLEAVEIDFHGGEPMLLKKQAFVRLCSTLRGALDTKCKLRLGMQTNGTLIDDEWIAIFEEFEVGIGVSLDGPAAINDINRVDHRGRGSYADAARGFKLLSEAAKNGRCNAPGLLCVINPSHDARAILRHFVFELGATYIDFLLPDVTRNTVDPYPKQRYGQYLTDLYLEWLTIGRKDVHIRCIARAVSPLVGGRRAGSVYLDAVRSRHAITIATNGDVGPNDIFKIIDRPYFSRYNVATSSLREFMEDEDVKELIEAELTLPKDCRSCCWRDACHGGEVYNRYDKRTGFDNPSSFCVAYKHLYSFIAAHLIESGTVSSSQVCASLGLTEDSDKKAQTYGYAASSDV